MKTFHTTNFALACGLTCSIGMLLLGLSATYFNWGSEIVSITGTFYLGYTETVPGSVLGAVWGFIDGFIGGYIFAWIYNALMKN